MMFLSKEYELKKYLTTVYAKNVTKKTLNMTLLQPNPMEKPKNIWKRSGIKNVKPKHILA